MNINTILQKFNLEVTSFIEQLPGYFLAKDINSKFILASKKTANLFGYDTIDSMLGMDDYDLKCDATRCAKEFQHQDRIVINNTFNNNKIDFFGYYGYADKWKVTINNKCALVNEHQEVIGVSLYITDVTNLNLIDLSYFLVKTDRKYCYEASRNQASYIINDSYLDEQLTLRQAQCLFFLLRGKSIKAIAKILNLSPRTIETYIENIKHRLKCNTKSELIEKALEKGYMNILPRSLLTQNLLHQLK